MYWRYLLFFWLFKDASRGNQFERAAAMAHNRERAPFLLVYLRRWMTVGSLLILVGAAFEFTGCPWLAAFCFAACVLTVSVDVTLIIAYLGLSQKL